MDYTIYPDAATGNVALRSREISATLNEDNIMDVPRIRKRA